METQLGRLEKVWHFTVLNNGYYFMFKGLFICNATYRKGDIIPSMDCPVEKGIVKLCSVY